MPGRYLDPGDWDDGEREILERELDWFRRRTADYRRVLSALPDGTWYWHLFWKGERINGGLSPSREDALADSWHAITRHLYTRGATPVVMPGYGTRCQGTVARRVLLPVRG